jgi:hypothetical protein
MRSSRVVLTAAVAAVVAGLVELGRRVSVATAFDAVSARLPKGFPRKWIVSNLSIVLGPHRIIALLKASPGYRTVQGGYSVACVTRSDINEHLPTLMAYAQKCTSIAELGVRSVVSTWAFAEGLRTNGCDDMRLLMNDTVRGDEVDTFLEIARAEGIDASFELGSDLEIPIPQDFDLVFIDTFHVYGQAKRELERWGPQRGLLPAIDEFLEAHREWQRREVFLNNNGLTILQRI